MLKIFKEEIYNYVHWSQSGLYIFGWRVNTVKGFNTIESLCIEKDIDTSWMYRHAYFLGKFVIFWSKR